MKLFNFWRCWLPLFALGLFISRCLYEWNPLQFAWLGVWWVVVPAVLAVVLLIRWLMTAILNMAAETAPRAASRETRRRIRGRGSPRG